VRLRPDFKKLVQIRRHDAQVPQSLKQRHLIAAGPIKNPLVKGQNTVVSVDETNMVRHKVAN
jgi:hypothetical protein